MSVDLMPIPMPSLASEATLRHELRTAIESLTDRHLQTTREWFPHEYVPWERARTFDPAVPWSAEDSALSPAARVAVFVGLLTEDNLPYYYRALSSVADDGPWEAWARRWTAEEGRHSIVIRDYLTVTRAIDPVELERARMRQVATGIAPEFESLADALVYATLQELATRISHRNTGKLIDDPVGVEVMNRVAADENLHHLFYRDLVTAAIEVAPSAMVCAIDRVVRTFAMPGVGIDDFQAHARTMATARVYDFELHHDQVVAPIVLGRWDLEGIEGLDATAERAREGALRHIRRLAVAARRVRS
ncbi:MAG: acyl-ACP desaturase, partial [Acidimicrobiia bacterium]